VTHSDKKGPYIITFPIVKLWPWVPVASKLLKGMFDINITTKDYTIQVGSYRLSKLTK